MNRELPPAEPSGPRNNHINHAPDSVRTTGATLRRRVVRGLQALLIGSLALSIGVAQSAHADELDDKKKQLDSQIQQSKKDLETYNADAANAALALQNSEAALATAEKQLVAAEAAETSAAAKDKDAAAALVVAQQKLAAAKDEAARAEADVQAWMKTVGKTVVQTQQQRTDLLGLAVLTTNQEMSSLNQRVQWSRTLMDSTQAKLDRLRSLQLVKQAAEQKAADAEADVAAKREAAKQAYADAQNAAAASQSARDQRAAAVATNQQAKQNADAHVAAEEKRQADLVSESNSVAKRIADRIAAAKAAAERAAAAKKKAEQEAAEAAKRAAAARAAAAKASAAKKAAAQREADAADAAAAAAKKRAASTSSGSSGSSSSKGLIYPSGAVITSPYGMRLHPILRVWKLHDGTDFGAGCGTPIRAAASGVVEEKYYNTGYGNRLIIDHGQVNGRYLTTAYNHATHYIVGVGQRVSQGQVIGYVGSTGYSTGCHLHFMAYSNGSLINPMSLY
ncbi:M23 family metallopeptidase [Propionibacteriaceae bacterium G1746]|uniref:M23 family metallopeptidase n=1 Tax=Aestuariimicrobium sp. G57 TaxID=3418485 RepID=UPI003C22EA20